MSENVKLNEGFTQVCIWEGTSLGNDTAEDFVEWVKNEFNARAQFLEEVITKPSRFQNGTEIPGTGGRHDLVFAVHSEDINHFAIPRIRYGIRWIEDVYGNGAGHLYEDRLADYRSWDYND